MRETLPLLDVTHFPALQRREFEILQINLGYRCNQQCLHCHVNAGPKRDELMSREVIDQVLTVAQQQRVQVLDLTGGAPEMNPEFRYLVTQARGLGLKVVDRCNLTILSEPGYEGLADFLAEQQVEMVASLPCYLEANVDAQRGRGVFGRSIAGLRQLNQLGYGQPGSGLILNLVYNPQGPVLPPGQQVLEQAYKVVLAERYQVHFNQLFTLTNMPIKRFGSALISKGQFNEYMQLLHESYSASNLDSVMCRTLLSVDWQGYLYDCDFNQMLGLPAGLGKGKPLHISELHGRSVAGEPIVVKDHCFGCTAGQGSSCGGALN